MEGVCNEISLLCRQHEIPFFVFVPDEIREAYIPNPEQNNVNKKLRLAAVVTHDGRESVIADARREPIPPEPMVIDYINQFETMVDQGMTVLEKHNCERCSALWKGITRDKTTEIFDRETFVEQVRALQKYIDQMCPTVDISVAFPPECDLRIYDSSYEGTIEHITNLLQNYEHTCVFVVGLEYFDKDDDRKKVKFYFGGGDMMDLDEIKFVRDLDNNY